MGQLGDAVVQFPISGAQVPPEIYMRTAVQAVSATMYVLMHPGGSMTGSRQIAPSNPNRVRWSLMNSGSLAFAMEKGTQDFNPNGPVSPTNNYDNVVLGTVTLQGNQGVQPSVSYFESDPCYTGPIRGGWIGSGTLSGSAAVLTEYIV